METTNSNTQAAAVQTTEGSATTAVTPDVKASETAVSTPVVPAPEAAKAAEKPERGSRIAAEKLRVLQERSKLEQTRAQIVEESKALNEWKQTIASKDPLKILKAAGMTPEQTAQFLLNGGTMPPADAKVQELETRLQETQTIVKSFQQKQEETVQAQQKAEVDEARAQAIAAIGEAKEQLPWVNALGQGAAVIDEMNAHYKKTGEMIDLEQAALQVEKRLSDAMPSYLKGLVGNAHVKDLLKKILAEVDAPKDAEGKAVADTVEKIAEGKAEEKLTIAPPKSYRYQRPALNNDMAQTRANTVDTKPKRPDQLWAELKKKIGS